MVGPTPGKVNEYAEPGELINFRPIKPRIHLRFGIWTCVTKWPFVCGCGYDVKGAWEEWKRIMAEKNPEPLEIEIEEPLIPPDPRVLCSEVREEVE